LNHEVEVPNGRISNSLLLLVTVVGLLSASGATCQRQLLTNPFAAPGPAAPQVLMEGASREQIIAAVNQNSSRIQSLTVTGATITVPDTLGLPLLSGNIAAERPGRFRLTAGTAVTGQEIDLGSNDELFWLWVRRNQPPGVYFCRHAQFATSNIRQMMPVEPSWLLAALGMVDLDPASVFDGPLPRGDGTVELRSWLPSRSGTLQRVTVIEARRALVVEQHVYDQSGRTLLASAVAETHRYDPLQQVSLPQLVSIRLPPANMALKINLGTVQINQLTADRAQLWTMPAFDGAPQYDLGGATAGTPLPGRAANRPLINGVAPANYVPYPSTSYAVTPASVPVPPTAAPSMGASAAPLSIYGQRSSPPMQHARRY
jgi:hypothetical protein